MFCNKNDYIFSSMNSNFGPVIYIVKSFFSCGMSSQLKLIIVEQQNTVPNRGHEYNLS